MALILPAQLAHGPAASGRVAQLTKRERQALYLAAQGLSNDEIAARLHLGERTVRSHISNILRKLHVAHRTQLALYALRARLARPAGG